VTAAAWAAGLPLTSYVLGVRREPSTAVVARMATEVPPRVAPGADTRIVLSFGANDATVEHGRVRVAPEEGVAALEKALGFGLPAFVVGPPPVSDEEHDARIEALSARFAEVCAARDVPFLGVVAALRRTGPWCGEARAGDGAHPGAGGYAQLAALVADPLLRWLADPA
jgi:lysophospholipase L1-like esterase